MTFKALSNKSSLISWIISRPYSFIIMHLRHIHLPGLTKYSHAIALQSKTVDAMIEHGARMHRNDSLLPLNSTLITFQSHPTYTCGRREVGRLSPSQIAYLKNDGLAEFYEASRGGLTTFHGPGQLTAFLICSLRDNHLKPRAYVHRLETMTIDVCKHYGVTAFTTENPGVWNTHEDKIASVGVRLRSGISSYGVGLNVSVDLSWFHRIVACGLIGKSATSFEKIGIQGLKVEDVAAMFAQCVASRLAGEGKGDPAKSQSMTVERVYIDENSVHS